jgi:CxxC motif-containing protein
MEKKDLICIMCPIGCHVTIDKDLNVVGNKCKRGVAYAIEEMTHPKRILTTTVKTISNKYPRVSVKTNKPLEKELIFTALEKLNKIILKKDVKIGDVIIKNICNTDVDIVATKQIHI